MLALQRKLGEKIFLILPNGDKVEILFQELTGRNRLSIGIDAPRNIRIVRDDAKITAPRRAM